MLPNELVHHDQLAVLNESLTRWSAFCNYHHLDPVDTLEKIPSILLVDSELVEQRVSDLSEYFANRKEIDTLLKNVPVVLMYHDNEIKAKMELFIRQMRVFPRTLASSKALAYDIEHVKVICLQKV